MNRLRFQVPLRKQRAVIERFNAAGEPASDKPDKENDP